MANKSSKRSKQVNVSATPPVASKANVKAASIAGRGPVRIARVMASAVAAKKPAATVAGATQVAGQAAAETGNTMTMGARRVVRSQDFLNQYTTLDRTTLLMNRAHAATQFHLELAEASKQLGFLRTVVLVRTIPTTMMGRVLQPDGAPGARLQLEFQTPGLLPAQGRRLVVTDSEGDFALTVPAGVAFPEQISFTFRGSNKSAVVAVKASQIAANGFMGNILLPEIIEPLPVSIIASLENLLPAQDSESIPVKPLPPAQIPQISVGEGGECLLTYRTDVSVDRFPYSVFVRLVEPRTSIVSPVIRYAGTNKKYFPVTDYFPLSEGGGVEVDYVDRVPVDQPISVDGFHDHIVGVGEGTFVSPYETVSMAGTLGLGYVVRMAQLWTPKGLTLGNLIYSLPLAPGEQQRVAVFERQETTIVRETEMLSAEEQQRFEQETDASTQSIFSSAFEEAAMGGSAYKSKSSSYGYSFLFGGGGGSSSSGSSSSWMSGHRDYTSRAAEELRTSLNRQAEARRRAFRTSMRLATNFESADVMTKVITNHNHLHALTLQYWEVQRLYEVSSTVEGVTLVCLVPLQVIRFLPPGQPLMLANISGVDTRDEILKRYSQILKHADVLDRWLPRQYRSGMTLLKQFAADPTATFQTAGRTSQDVIHFSIFGTFLPFEEIYVSAVTRRGTRIGPVCLTGTIPKIVEADNDPANAFASEDALLAELRRRRTSSTGYSLQGSIAIPLTTTRNDIVGFEITRRFQSFDYQLVNSVLQFIKKLGLIVSAVPDNPSSQTIHLTPQMLERDLSGPLVWNFSADIPSLASPPAQGTYVAEETYAADYLAYPGQQLPTAAFPIPALQLSPVLRYSQLLEIEGMLQQVVRNPIHYSKAVWQSLTPEERVVMLEGYTIGVPPGGIADESQNVPLLNCVENRVLGFYGNSMIMPFIIPLNLAESMKITNADIQDTLMEFHKTAFSPTLSIIALPTRGVLAEAVLGHCPSGEKIDITRFWNWQDSPSDTAPNITDLTLPTTKSVTTGVQGPSALTGIPAMINNLNANPNVPGSDATLLQAMIQAAAQEKGFDISSLTNAEALAKLLQGNQQMADKARADALQTTKQLQAQAMATAGNILGGIYAKNPQAGSQAASAVYNTGTASTDAGSAS